MTLIEVVISIVVIATAVGAVLGVFAKNVEKSADALIVSQAIAVAEAYLEEVTLKAFGDPDGDDTETLRGEFDDADDYDGMLDIGAADQFGNPIPELAGYTIAIDVQPTAALPGIPATDALRIDVRVQFAPFVDYTLSTYKTRL
jgi:MSHA pilin protein MshD